MQSPEEIAESLQFVQYQYYDGWFVHLASDRLGPYGTRGDAEVAARIIEEHVTAALRAYGDQRAAQERERIEQAISAIGGLDGVIHLSVASVIVGIRSTTKDRV